MFVSVVYHCFLFDNFTMSVSTSKIDDHDDKVRCVVGKLLSLADETSKTVLTAFDSSKDRTANVKVLGGSKFQTITLDTCATFLGIPVTDDKGARLFSNKPALAMRIVLEIESHFPAMCSDCSEEYSIELNSTETPALRCFLCFQGSHGCPQFTDKFATLPPVSDQPSGMVWLCSSCKSVNNPIKTKQPKSRTGVNTNGSLPPSVVQTPGNSGLQTPATPTTDPGANHEPNLLSDHSLCPEELSRKLARVKNDQDQNNTVCDNFKIGKCPHGVSGRTIHNGTTCPKKHPKRCRKYMRFGNDKKKGCSRGTDCESYHPKHCKSSLSQRKCFNQNCCLVHLCGTQRFKSTDPSNNTKNPNSQGALARNQSKDKGSNQTPGVPKTNIPNQTPNNSKGNSFLEIKDLLESLKDNFQKELSSLKSHIAFQDTRISALNPSTFRLGYPQNHSLPHHLIPQQMNNPTQMIPAPQLSQWPPLPQSSC